MAATIEIMLNGEPRRIAAGRTVAGLLGDLGLHPGLVVVEHNREILDRARYDGTEVRAGDTIELVHFVGGG
ncbi:MAG TPA: sulfur carrier protein ThiS [Longimicrobiales bacterium]